MLKYTIKKFSVLLGTDNLELKVLMLNLNKKAK